MQFRAHEFETTNEAIQWTYAAGSGEAITLAGRKFVVDAAEAGRLEAAGVEFAYLCDHTMPDGSSRIVTVPVN